MALQPPRRQIAASLLRASAAHRIAVAAMACAVLWLLVAAALR